MFRFRGMGPSGFRGLELFQRRVVAVGVLAHGAVVHADVGLAQKGQGEGSVRRTDAALSVDVDLGLGRNADAARQSP